MGLTFNLGRVSPSVFTDSSLNVGIGAAPSGTYKLEVTGTAKVSTSAYFAIASGSVGIGTITPTSYFYSGNGLAIYNASQNTLSIATDTSGTSSLYFSNGASGAARYNGYLEYIHSTNSMTFGTGGFTRLTLTSSSAAFSGSVTSSANGSTFGTASAGGRSIILQADSGNGAITFRNAAGGDGNLLVTGTSTSLNYRFDTYSVGNAFAILNAGNIGIGVVPTQSAALTFADSLAQKILLNNNANNYRIDLASAVSGGDAMIKFVAGSLTAGEVGFYTTTNLRILITNGGTLQFSNNPTSNYEIDSSTRISIAPSGTFPFANFSGMVVVTNMSNGATGIWLVGSGATSLVSNVGGTAGLGTFAYTSGNAGYTWTSNYNITANYGFFAVRTRPEA